MNKIFISNFQFQERLCRNARDTKEFVQKLSKNLCLSSLAGGQELSEGSFY